MSINNSIHHLFVLQYMFELTDFSVRKIIVYFYKLMLIKDIIYYCRRRTMSAFK